jgi:hypothetical protein
MATNPPPDPSTPEGKRYRGADGSPMNPYVANTMNNTMPGLRIDVRAADCHVFINMPYKAQCQHYDAWVQVNKLALSSKWLTLQPKFLKSTHGQPSQPGAARSVNPIFAAGFENYNMISNQGRPLVTIPEVPVLLGKLSDLYRPLRDGPFGDGGAAMQHLAFIRYAIVHSAVRADLFDDFETFRLAVTHLPAYIDATTATPTAAPANSTRMPSELAEMRKMREALSLQMARLRQEHAARILELESKVHVLQMLSLRA